MLKTNNSFSHQDKTATADLKYFSNTGITRIWSQSFTLLLEILKKMIGHNISVDYHVLSKEFRCSESLTRDYLLPILIGFYETDLFCLKGGLPKMPLLFQKRYICYFSSFFAIQPPISHPFWFFWTKNLAFQIENSLMWCRRR